MTDNEYLLKIHGEILEIMDVIHAMCIENHLKYYLTGGSLLGAVRHKGFIPWDDDLDIAMPRNDYNRFFEICEGHLPDKYVVKKIEPNSKYTLLHSKVCKVGTVFTETNMQNNVISNGIFVDIFPLDDSDGNMRSLSFRKTISQKIRKMIDEKQNLGTLRGIKKIIAHIFSCTFLMKALNLTICGSNNKGKLYYTNFASNYSVERKTQPKTVYGDGIPIQFENRMYIAPDDYDTDLRSNFGPKYMELPPIEKRRTHYPSKVVFSDGAVFEPTSNNDNKVSIEESIDW